MQEISFSKLASLHQKLTDIGYRFDWNGMTESNENQFNRMSEKQYKRFWALIFNHDELELDNQCAGFGLCLERSEQYQSYIKKLSK